MKSTLVTLSVLFLICTLSCKNDDQALTKEGGNPLQNVELTNATTAVDGDGNQYEVGYNQVSKINQDPLCQEKRY